MDGFLLFLIIIIIIGVIVFLYIKYRKPKQNTLLCYSGTNGGGKTFNATHDIRKFYRKATRKWRSVNYPIFYVLIDWIPYFHRKRICNEFYGLDKPKIYSNYPIIIKKTRKHLELSEPITNEIMFLEKSIPFGSQVIIDEFSSWIDQFNYNNRYSATLNDHIQKWRHYHGDLSHFICIDQCTNNIPLQVRYRLNQAILCKRTQHYFGFIHITSYKCIELADDIKSVELLDNDKADTEDKTLKLIRFGFKRYYDSRAWSNRYWYVDFNDINTKYSCSPLKVDLPLPSPDKRKDYVSLDVSIKEYKNKKS